MSRTTKDQDAAGDAAGDPTRDPAFARTRPRPGPGRPPGDTGDPGTGDPWTGALGTGDLGTGDLGTGDLGTGDLGTGDLAADVTGPVHEPDGVNAVVELVGLVDVVPAGLVGVLGAVDSADVATAVRWAAAHAAAVVVLGRAPASDGPQVPAPRAASDGPSVAEHRPTLAVTCRRVDRVVLDVTLGTARVGVGAAWSAVRAILGPTGLPADGLVGDALDGLAEVTTLRGATVVTADGLLHRVDDEESPELWEGVLRGDGAAGTVTELELALC